MIIFDFAVALKQRNPGLQVLNADQARQLNILPSKQRHVQSVSPRSMMSPPPVAVVQGKPASHTDHQEIG